MSSFKYTIRNGLLAFLSVLVLGMAPPLRAETASGAPTVSARHVEQWRLSADETHDYQIFVSVPSAPAPAGGFPVLYVLDGNAWFGVAAEIARLSELAHGPMIVIGVGYPGDGMFNEARRVPDLTPVPTPDPIPTPPFVSRQDDFLSFLRTTLRDEVARHYPIDRQRQIVFGHSLAGLFVLHALFTAPNSFNVFIAASPSIWWNKPVVEREMEAWLAHRKPVRDPRILLEIGGLEQTPPPSVRKSSEELAASNKPPFTGKTAAEIEAMIAAEWKRARMIDNVRELDAKLVRAGVQAPLVLFEGEGHGSVVPAALGRAIPMALTPRSTAPQSSRRTAG